MKGTIRITDTGRRRYFLGDTEVTEEEFNAAFPAKEIGQVYGPSLTGWPMVSRALAVNPRQVAKANARNKRMGSKVRYDKKGNAHLPDRGARRDLLRIEKLHDNDGGYGD